MSGSSRGTGLPSAYGGSSSERAGAAAGGAPAAGASRPAGRILDELVSRAGAVMALLITREGTGVAEAGDTSYLNTTALAALVAGMFSATREVARLVGEEHFAVLLQQGENRHIHISLITDAAMLVIVFEDLKRIGLVRHEARKSAEELAGAFSRRREEALAVREELSLPRFREYALNIIDRIFDEDGRDEPR